MGASIGHVSDDVLGLVTMVGLITIALSSHMITFSHHIYTLVEPWLELFERNGTPRENADIEQHQRHTYQVIVFGLGRFGTAIALRLRQRGVHVLGIDFNPEAVKRWRALGLEADFGDATDAEFVSELPLRSAQWVLATVPNHPTGLSHEDIRRTLVQLVRAGGFKGRIAATSHSADDTESLLRAGIDRVLEPFQDAADRAVDMLWVHPPT
jgi:hypothetical protein